MTLNLEDGERRASLYRGSRVERLLRVLSRVGACCCMHRPTAYNSSIISIMQVYDVCRLVLKGDVRDPTQVLHTRYSDTHPRSVESY